MALMMIEKVGESLHLDNMAKLVMYRNLNEKRGYETGFIPEYGNCGDHAAFSATELLKKNGVSAKTG